MKETTNLIRATGQMAQSTHSFGFHVREAENPGSPHAVRFYLSPNTLARIQLRTISRQKMDAQLPLIGAYFLSYLPGLMRGVAIPNQEDGFRPSHHQTVQESANHLPIHLTLFNHKPHAAAPIHHAEHVQAIPRPRTLHHRRLPLNRPGRPRMIIASQTRFISKPYLCLHLL